MAVENLFPNYLACNGIDSNRRHAEATEAAQAAWGRTVAANERNERDADARRNAIKKRDEVAPRGCVFAKSCNLPDGVINHNNPSGLCPLKNWPNTDCGLCLAPVQLSRHKAPHCNWCQGLLTAVQLLRFNVKTLPDGSVDVYGFYLLGQFCSDNQRKIAEGKAPIAIETEHVGERMRFEIHHVVYIKNGGDVYNVDNLAVMTPKLHVQTHKENK